MMNIPPGVDPSTAEDATPTAALAALQSMALSPVQNDLQQPAGGGKYYVAARVRPVAALSKLAEALMASKGYDQAMPALAQQYAQGAQAFAPGGQTVPGQPLQARPQPSDPNTQSVQPAIQRLRVRASRRLSKGAAECDAGESDESARVAGESHDAPLHAGPREIRSDHSGHNRISERAEGAGVIRMERCSSCAPKR